MSEARVGHTIGIATNWHNGMLILENLLGLILKLAIVATKSTLCIH